jgi:hypothetical protein
MPLRVLLTLLVPKEDVVGNHRCRFKEGMMMKREVPARGLHNGVEEYHRMRLRRLHLKLMLMCKMMHLMEMTGMTTTMMLDMHHLTEGMVVDRPI